MKQKAVNFLSSHPFKTFIIGCVLIFAIPFILTQPYLRVFSYEGTGQIGDTIGGITAPFIGLFSAMLVYFSFKEQNTANNLLKDQHVLNDIADNSTNMVDRIDKAATAMQYNSAVGLSALTSYLDNVLKELYEHALHLTNKEIDGNLSKEEEIQYRNNLIRLQELAYSPNFSQVELYLKLIRHLLYYAHKSGKKSTVLAFNVDFIRELHISISFNKLDGLERALDFATPHKLLIARFKTLLILNQEITALFEKWDIIDMPSDTV